MASQMTRSLATAATLIHSFTGAAGVSRALIEMPAWQKTGPLSWAAFSRHADLGPVGNVLYPLIGFAGAFLSIGGAISFHRDPTAPKSAAMPFNMAALMSIGGLLVTIKAAPNMLRVRHLGDDEAALQEAMDGFEFWGGIRTIFQGLAFVAS